MQRQGDGHKQSTLPLRNRTMIRRVFRRSMSPRGQALLEFAFIAPIVLIFLFVIVDFGIAVDRRIALQHAVREGARQGAVTNDISAIRNTTVGQSQGLLAPANVTVCYQDADSDGIVGTTGDNVKVSASFTYNFSVPFTELFNAIGASVPSGIAMNPSADMRLENANFGAPPC